MPKRFTAGLTMGKSNVSEKAMGAPGNAKATGAKAGAGANVGERSLPGPRLPGYKIRQHLVSKPIADLDATLRAELKALQLQVKPGARIAIGIGSRGISNRVQIAKGLIDFLKELGAVPFVVPAMGSHGGATAAGQKEILEGLGLTEAALGAPILSDMAVIEVPFSGNGQPLSHKLYMGKTAFEADGVILFNRIKPHTDFHSTYESGLVKMSVVGLGNHEQAKIMHGLGVPGLRDLIPLAAREIFATGKILFGLAVVEDGHDETMILRALKPEQIMADEPGLLREAVAAMPKLPAEKIDILIVDSMGKNISGTGMDPNIIGRIKVKGTPEPTSPDITTLIVDDLSEASHGNALGMGLADLITRKLFDKIDFKAMYANVVTTTFLERGKTPIVADDLQHAFAIAQTTIAGRRLEDLRVMRIPNTLHLEEVVVSPTIYREIADQVELISETENILE